MAGSAPNVDLKALLTFQESVAPVSAGATVTGTTCDLKGHESAAAVASTDSIAGSGGTIAFTLEESDASGSGFSAIAAADLSGAFVAASADDRTELVGIVRSKRYVRVVATKAGTVSAGIMHAMVVANASRHL